MKNKNRHPQAVTLNPSTWKGVLWWWKSPDELAQKRSCRLPRLKVGWASIQQKTISSPPLHQQKPGGITWLTKTVSALGSHYRVQQGTPALPIACINSTGMQLTHFTLNDHWKLMFFFAHMTWQRKAVGHCALHVLMHAWLYAIYTGMLHFPNVFVTYRKLQKWFHVSQCKINDEGPSRACQWSLWEGAYFYLVLIQKKL